MLYVLFLFSIFLEYVRPGSFLPLITAVKLNTLVPLLAIVLTIFSREGIANARIFRHSNSRWILFFLLLLLVSVLIADVTLYSYNIFKLVLGFVIWYYIIARLTVDFRQIHALFVVLVVSHVILLFLNLPVITDPASRHYLGNNAFLGDGNDFALSVCIILPMCLYVIWETKNTFLKFCFVVALLLLVLAVIGTQSRGGSVALAALSLYLWWVGRQKIIGAIFLVSLVVLVINYAPPEYFERLNTIINFQEEGSAQGRLIAWKTAYRMMIEYPLTGVGTGHFPVKLGTEFRPPEFGDENLPWLTAHSVYFLLMGELGIPGIVFLLAILVGNFFRNSSAILRVGVADEDVGIRFRRLFVALNASLVAFAVGGAFLSVPYYPHLYVLAGIFTAAQHLFADWREKGQTGPPAPEQVMIGKPSRFARRKIPIPVKDRDK